MKQLCKRLNKILSDIPVNKLNSILEKEQNVYDCFIVKIRKFIIIIVVNL